MQNAEMICKIHEMGGMMEMILVEFAAEISVCVEGDKRLVVAWHKC